MTSKHPGGRPRVLKDPKTRSFVLDKPSRDKIDERAEELGEERGKGVTNSEALRDIIREAT